MADPRIGVVFESTYKGNLEKILRNEQRRMAAMQRWLNSHPLEIAYKVDVNGIKAQVAQARDAAMGELRKTGTAAILGADGKPAMREAAQELSKVQGLLSEATRKTFGPDGDVTGRYVQQVEQIGNGLQRISEFKFNEETGRFDLTSETEKNVSSVKQLEDALRGVNKELGREFADAKGRGDKAGQLAALKKQKQEVDTLLRDAASGGLAGSAAYTRAESAQDRLASRIAGLEGARFSDAEKKSRADRRLAVEREMKAEQARATAALKANKLEADQAERLLPDRVAYEKEINRIYQERRRIFEQSQDYFKNLDKQLLGEGREDLAVRAFRRSLNAESQARQADLDLSRANTDSQRRGQKERETEQSRQLKSDVDFQRRQQAERESAGAKRLREDVAFGQKRIREKAKRDREARESVFRQEMQDIKAMSDRRIARINAEEKRVRAATRSVRRREEVAERAHRARQVEYASLAGSYFALEHRARGAGHVETADKARGQARAAGTAMERDMARFAAATRRSGHALDFHTSSLTRNAATFLRWQIPMRAVMAIQEAFTEGVSSAVRVERQYATLQAVFHGTSEEARMLKDQTLELAIAQGRSADEAIDGAIRWSRLGLTRLQVLEATRVSLMASNVAEVSAAEAAEKLSGIYATYKLNVGDLASVLNRLNSISNNYNVTVKDLFEGIARVGGVARQARLNLSDLEGIIGSVTGATGRPGQEIGNALKAIIPRISDINTVEKLKEAFDFDITGPNGDLKDMSQILREMADLFPTLNKAEQQYFLRLVAGRRQAARFALVMTEFRQGQILAARAAADHAASQRENELILASLQSRIDALQASWTNFAVSIGDAGAYQRAGEFMRYLQGVVLELSGALDSANEKGKDFLVQNPATAELIERIGGGENKWFGTRSTFDRRELQRSLEVLRAAQGELAKTIAERKKLIFPGFGVDDLEVKVGGFNGRSFNQEELAARISDVQELLKEGGDTGFKDELQNTVRTVMNLREELDFLGKSRGVFDSLAKGVANGSADRKVLVRDFRSMVSLLTELGDGGKLYRQANEEFAAILASGDMEEMASFLERMGRIFSDRSNPASQALEDEISRVLPILDAKLIELDDARREIERRVISGVKERRQQDDALRENAERAKEVRALVEQVNAEVEKSTESAFGGPANARINRFLDDVMNFAKAFGDAFKDFAVDGANDPVERIIGRQRRALELGLETLGKVRKSTEADAAAKRIESAAIDDEETRNRIIDQQDEAAQLIKTRIEQEEERLEQLRRELEYEEQILGLKRAQNDASKEAGRSAAAFRFGETESDKDANQARAAIARANQGGYRARARWLAGDDTPASRAADVGQVTQDEATARRALEAMQQRNYEIDAARRQIAYDLLKAEKEQTDEASKRYQLASREDQLRASVLARTIRDRGKVGSDEFSFLSQNVRQALVNFLPDEAPGNLNPARAEAEKTRRELNEEQARLKRSIAEVGAALDILAKRITVDSGKGGALDITKGVARPGSVQSAADSRDKNPYVKLDIGALNLQVKLAEQFNGIVRDVVEDRISTEIRALESRLRDRPIPNPQSAVE